MEPNEQAAKLQRVVEKNRHFENLLTNDDFLKWRDESVLPHLESIKAAVLSEDTSQPGWRERVAEGVIAYQQALKTYDTLFVLASKNAEMGRRALASLAKSREGTS